MLVILKHKVLQVLQAMILYVTPVQLRTVMLPLVMTMATQRLVKVDMHLPMVNVSKLVQATRKTNVVQGIIVYSNRLDA